MRSLNALASQRRPFGIGSPADANRRLQSLAKLRRFLDNEAKRPAQGDGIRPIETVPYKIIRPIQQVRYAPGFARSARKRGARFVNYALLHFRVSALSVERPGRHEEATRKRSGRGMGESLRIRPWGVELHGTSALGARFEDHSVGASAVNNQKQAADRRCYFLFAD
jgi:hypothetical protein